MDDSSVVSQFQFRSFKIDQASFEVTPRVGNLEHDHVSPDTLDLQIAFRNPQRLQSEQRYVVGLGIEVKSINKKTKEQVFLLHMGISGLFFSEGIETGSDEEDQLVRYQAPALLFSHLRGAVASFLANAGFSAIVIPLINVYALAREANIVIEDLKYTEGSE